jgi:hypothetical protein
MVTFATGSREPLTTARDCAILAPEGLRGHEIPPYCCCMGALPCLCTVRCGVRRHGVGSVKLCIPTAGRWRRVSSFCIPKRHPEANPLANSAANPQTGYSRSGSASTPAPEHVRRPH